MKNEKLLKNAKELLAVSDAVPFLYDHETRLFSFGKETFTANELPQWEAPHKGGRDTTVEDITDFIATTPMLHTREDLIALPQFHQFIQEGWTESLEDETTTIMAEVMNLDDEVPQKQLRDCLGFRAIRLGQEEAQIALTTFSGAASVEPDMTSKIWGTRFSPLKISRFVFENIDRPSQRASLAAGLGHIALRARQWYT